MEWFENSLKKSIHSKVWQKTLVVPSQLCLEFRANMKTVQSAGPVEYTNCISAEE